jgi:hypothetical protein
VLNTIPQVTYPLYYWRGENNTRNILLPELIQEFGDLCNACVNVRPDELGILDDERIELAA